jgi:hypothetical protein
LISVTRHTKHLPAKAANQIHFRLKNMRRSTQNAESLENCNPIAHFFKTGRAPAVVPLVELPLHAGVPLKHLVESGRRDDIPEVFIERILQPIREKLSRRPVPIEQKEIVVVEPDFPDMHSDDSTDSDESEVEDRTPAVRRKRRHTPAVKTIKPQPANQPVKRPKYILPDRPAHYSNPSQSPLGIKTEIKTSPRPILPSNCSLQYIMNSTGNHALTPLRLLPCLDGNETPVSLSESDTPTLPPPAKRRSPPKTPTKPVFNSPLKLSPFKSPLKSLTNTFSRSPLKAASDRIIRKYSSPSKRVGRDSRRLSLNSITPKRLLGVESCKSPRTPPCLSSPLTSPREGELDTPTAVGRRKSRQQREVEVTMSLLGNLETQEEREQRELAETQEMFSSIQAVISRAPELENRYDEIIRSAGEDGAKETYSRLHNLLDGHPDVQVLLLDLLSGDEAVSLGPAVFSAYSDRGNLKRFLLKLGIVYRHQPAYHAKVIKELESLSKDSRLTGEGLKNVASRLFRSNQFLLDDFLMLIPGIQPPQSMLPSPEMITLIDDDDGVDGLDVELVPVPRSPPPLDPAQTTLPSVRFTNGSCYVQDGKNLKPARVERVPFTSIKENK